MNGEASFFSVIAAALGALFGGTGTLLVKEWRSGGWPWRRKDVTEDKFSVSVSAFRASDTSEFVQYGEHLLEKARKISLIGTGLNILHKDPVLTSVMTRASEGECDLEIFLADPWSPNVEVRLIEEESGRNVPPVGRQGLIQRLRSILDMRRNLGMSPHVSIRLFRNYPTFALLIIDANYFIYPYGYAELGNYSPVLGFSADEPSHADIVTFLQNHYQSVKKASYEAEIGIQSGSQNIMQYREHLVAFALYLVPSRNSGWYEFGSEILGYDVRDNKLVSSTYANEVGSAHHFGFHLTISDVLYFSGKEEMRSLIAEIRFLAQEVPRFKLSSLSVMSSMPDSKSISLVPHDESGMLEILHSESVARLFRRSLASDYTLGIAAAVRDNRHARSEAMLKRYRAPYILGSYRPHFTLMTNVNEADQPAIVKVLNNEIASRDLSALTVDTLCVMTQQSPGSRWHILEEIELA